MQAYTNSTITATAIASSTATVTATCTQILTKTDKASYLKCRSVHLIINDTTIKSVRTKTRTTTDNPEENSGGEITGNAPQLGPGCLTNCRPTEVKMPCFCLMRQ